MNRRRLYAEAMGAFVLVFFGTGAIVVDSLSGGSVSHVGIALTFGLAVLTMIYSIGPVSGAHMNPAVTIGFLAAGRFDRRDVLPYVLAQLLGATLASLCVLSLFGDVGALGATTPRGSAVVAFWLELILTTVLMFVILCVATGSKEQGLMAGIAVGGTVAMEAMFGGPVSGASMNPARSLAPAIVSGAVEHAWIYVAAPIAGALIGACCWRVTILERNRSNSFRQEAL